MELEANMMDDEKPVKPKILAELQRFSELVEIRSKETGVPPEEVVKEVVDDLLKTQKQVNLGNTIRHRRCLN